MTSLSRNIEHIGQIVRMQQAHVKDVEIQQPVNVAELMEDALRINQSSIEKRGVEIARDYAQLPTVLLDQHRVLQILINLVTNAVRATREDPNSRRRITLRIKEESTPESSQIVFQVADNGVGIAPENMTRIFAHGFTTHSDGHGFGLHSAANAAKEMGGDLTAASDGPGLGATFTLRLPIKREAAPNKGDTPSLTPVNK